MKRTVTFTQACTDASTFHVRVNARAEMCSRKVQKQLKQRLQSQRGLRGRRGELLPPQPWLLTRPRSYRPDRGRVKPELRVIQSSSQSFLSGPLGAEGRGPLAQVGEPPSAAVRSSHGGGEEDEWGVCVALQG